MAYDRNKYKIVLFRNGEKVKCFFSSNRLDSVQDKYNELISEKKPKFIVEYLSRKKVRFELGIVTTQDVDEDIYLKDDIGRTKTVEVSGDNYNMLKLIPYWREEFIYNHQTQSKVSYCEVIDTYLPVDDFKQVFTINNKLVIQNDDEFKMFSLKTVSDAARLIDLIEFDLLDDGRLDCLFVRDTNTTQRKQLYTMLESAGYDRAFLRKQYTY
tara:strand:- start:72 stop:707 length:636 start_codon:yes stop_codon:yes gene_type:complete